MVASPLFTAFLKPFFVNYIVLKKVQKINTVLYNFLVLFSMLGFNQMLLDILLFIIKTSLLLTFGQIFHLTKENNTKYICN